ncbi:MAG: carboxysome shell protein, partial [Betaproteobacteria bacterium]|nr:carboxysome shell protein [Betaproteobacteria bacterium]
DCDGAAGCGCRAGGVPAAVPAAPTASSPVQLAQGRRAAMQRRQAMSRVGRGQAACGKPSGRVRARDAGAVAPEVEQGHTLSGQRVTGTQVERSRRVTGNEPGSCRAVTGTEYIGSEQFDSLCSSRPAPGAPKVLGGHTERGQSFTGTLVDRPAQVTGGEQGADRSITGTRYLAPGVDAAPEKVALTHTAGGRSVTGTNVDAARRTTGDEAGICRPVTGIQYLSAEHFQGVCGAPVPEQPRKVSVMSSRDGQSVTGSGLGRAAQVTGNEAGSMRAVTGNQYFNMRDFGAANAAAANAAEVPARPKSVGDERPGCTRVTVAHSPSIQSRPALSRRAPGGAGMTIPARAVTGDRPGGGGAPTTGDERGACGSVTGTPYVGEDNRHGFCAAPAPRPRLAESAESRAEPCAGFSILTPGHAALGRERGSSITGSAMGTERITGPVNKAQGLITGTPEFRRQDAAPQAANSEPAPRAAQRLSGEGSQQGARISGDVWMERSRVSGTEGPSALSRNPSQRGQPRGTGTSAAAPREDERPQVPASRVTGSSGSTERGAVVTVSGGARG